MTDRVYTLPTAVQQFQVVLGGSDRNHEGKVKPETEVWLQENLTALVHRFAPNAPAGSDVIISITMEALL